MPEKNLIGQYYIDAIPRRSITRQIGRNIQPWPVKTEPFEFDGYTLPKEKIKLHEKSKKLLVRLTCSSGSKIVYHSILKYEGELQNMQSFKMNFEVLNPPQPPTMKKYERSLMSSVLEARFDQLVVEHLSETVTLAFRNKFKTQHKRLLNGPLKKYFLSLVLSEMNSYMEPSREKFNAVNGWYAPAMDDNEVIFEIIRAKLFDLQFNKLTLEKKIPMHIRPLPDIKPEKVLLRSWQLQKDASKYSNCNPFHNQEKITVKDFLSGEAIHLTHFEAPHYELRSHRLMYNLFDFANLEQKRFGASKFASTNRPKPLMTEQHFPHTAKEPEDTITSQNKSIEMSQFLNTTVMPQKRPFAEEELFAVSQSKRKSRREDRLINNLSQAGDFVHNASKQLIFSDGFTDDSTTSDSTNLFTIPFKPRNEYREVIINLTNIWQNHKIIQYLGNVTNLRIIEQELPHQCDFVVDATTCVLRIQLEKFFEVRSDGTLFYENTLKALLLESKKVVLLAEYSPTLDQADREIFWKIRLFLQFPEIQLYFTQNKSHDIGKWIHILSRGHSNSFEHPGADVLVALRFNQFLIRQLLSKYSLAEILIMTANNKTGKLKELLTNHQLERIGKLMTLGW